MCEFCVKHGEGKKWYLNAKNYSADLLSDVRRRKIVETHFYWVDTTFKKYFGFLKKLPLHIPLVKSSLAAILKRAFLYVHWGQVVPIEDVEQLLNITNSITRVPCVCRMSIKKKENRTCFLISMNPEKFGIADIIDQSYFGGPDIARFEKTSRESALKFCREKEAEGMIHTVWALKAPFIGTLCNCDYASGCIPMTMYKEIAPVIFRSEYVANIHNEKCEGCAKCAKVCQFSALVFNSKTQKMKIDTNRCYGCGVCRVVCKNQAIELIERALVKEAAQLW